MHKLSITAVVCLLSILSLSGCATIEGWFANPSASAIIQTTTTLAVGEAVLTQKTAAAQAQMAKDIITVTQKVQADLKMTVTLDQLVALVRGELVKVANPQEALAANTLLTYLAAQLKDKVSAGALKPADVVIVDQFASWVIAAALPYAGLPSQTV